MTGVIVVGAGPTGLTAALELARRGCEVRIVEKRPGPSQLSRAVGIQPRSMAILKPSGVAARIAAEAVQFEGMIFHLGTDAIARFPLNFDARSQIWGLPQDRTEAHLRAALEEHGIAPRYGVTARDVEEDEAGVTLRTSDGPERADYVIGADGVRSTIRAALGIGYPGCELEQRWSIADVTAGDWSDPLCFKGYLLAEGRVCVVVPMAPGRFRIIASAPDALAALPVAMKVTGIRRAAEFAISVRQAVHYRRGRVFLAGDAAHCHSPVGGRGMNLGIADAAELARRIDEGGLDGYEAARHADGAHVIRLSERARRMLQSTGTARRHAVVAAIRLAGAVPPLGRAAMRQLING